ncbi:hypothetical protein BDV95DRAFT_484828, partial [Massariosphaeria phaeospora]
KLLADITETALIAGAKTLQEFADASNDPFDGTKNRLGGGEGHMATLAYLKKELESVGDYYDIDISQKVDVDVVLVAEGSLTLDGKDQKVLPFQYSPSSPAAGVEGEVVVVKNYGCELTDFPAEVKGKIALIERNRKCDFGMKCTNAGKAGAKGAIMYNNEPGQLKQAVLGPWDKYDTEKTGKTPYVPAISVSQEQGVEIKEKIAAGGKVKAVIKTKGEMTKRSSHNVVATSKCGSRDSVVVLGGHTDSVKEGPGINDNGSGIIALLETAKALSKYNLKNAVRFGFWTAEETDLMGSDAYIGATPEAELKAIRAYLNFDMIASPNGVHGVYDADLDDFKPIERWPVPPGSAPIEKFFQDFFRKYHKETHGKDEKYHAGAELDANSDYEPFRELMTIPIGGLDSGRDKKKTEAEAKLFGGTAGVAYDKNYHGKGDNFANLDKKAFVVNAKAIAASVVEFGQSFKLLPKASARRDTDSRPAFVASLKRGKTAHVTRGSVGCGRQGWA